MPSSGAAIKSKIITVTQIKYKELVARWLKAAGAGFLIVFSVLVVTGIVLDHRKKMAPLNPALTEAKELDLDFDQVLREPDRFLEKHVIWCVQNRSRNEVYYRGDTNKGLTVFNHEQMPPFSGSKHASCTDMLLQLKGARKLSLGSGLAGVMFISAL